MKVNEKRLNSYIDKVCADAIKTVGADTTLENWHMVVGSHLIIDLRFTNEPNRIVRDDILKRVMYRLGRNVPKHFHLLVCAPKLYHYYANEVSSMYSFFPDRRFNHQQALALVHPFGEALILCAEYGYNRPEWSYDLFIKMEENGASHCMCSFSEFHEAYIKTFGEDPLDAWIRMLAEEESSNMKG